MKELLVVGCWLLVVSLTGCAIVGTGATVGTDTLLKTDAPLPQPPIAVIQPGPEIPPQLAAFSGAWFGRWDYQMDHLLAVEQIESPEKIIAVYSFGKGFGFHPGWYRVTGRFVENKLQFQPWPETTVTYEIHKGTLKAVYQGNRTRSEVNMRRIDLNLISIR